MRAESSNAHCQTFSLIDDMAKTFSEFLTDSLHTELELNQLDVNQESPYTAAKLLLLNDTMLTANANLVVSALKFAHQAHAALPLTSTLNNRVMFENEFVAITRIANDNTTMSRFLIESLIDKKLRSVVLAVDDTYGKLSYKVSQLDNGSLHVDFVTEEAQQLVSKINPTIIFNIS